MRLRVASLILTQAPAPSVDTYLTVRTPSALAWSRDGARLAIQLTNLDGSEIRVADASGQNRVTVARSIAPGRYTVDRPDLVWSRDGQQLFYRAGAQYYTVSATGGPSRPLLTDTLPREVVQLAPDHRAVSFIRDGDIWVLSLSDGTARRVTEGEQFLAALPDFFGRLQQWPRWSPDSRHIAFSAPWRRGSFGGSRVGVANVTTGTTRWITPADSTWAFTQVEWSPDSRRLAVSRLSSDYRHKQLIVVADTGGAERMIRHDSSARWIAHNIEPSFSPQWSPDGQRVAFVSIATGWRQLYLADAASGAVRPLTSGTYEVAAPSWSPDGRAILSVSTRDHPQAPRPVAIDPASGALSSLDSTLGSASDAWWPGYMAAPVWSPDSRRLAYALSSSADPYQVRTVTRTGSGYSPPVSAHSALADGLEAGAVIPLEAVSFVSKDGTTIRGVLYRGRRSGTGPRPPALVHMYGGWGQLATLGWDIAFKSRLFQYLASRGYTVFVVDPRGSDGYGASFAHGLYHDAAGKQADDLAAAAGFLSREGHADRDRIALFGHSYGAFLTLATILRAPGVFAAGVLQAGVFDFPRFIPLAVPYASLRFGTQALYTERGRPARHVDRLSAPVLVAHGTADFNAPHAGSEILVTELMRAGKDFEFISYPNERHDWERPETARDFVRRVAAFLDRAMPAQPRTP